MTMVSFSDKERKSENGLFTLSSCSPSNGNIPLKDGSFPKYLDNDIGFQSNWRLRLCKGNQVLWEKWKFQGDKPPVNLFISNSGWSVIHAYSYTQDNFYVLSPKGQQKFTLIVSPETEGKPTKKSDGFAVYRSKHIRWSTAGLMWTNGSFIYFLETLLSKRFIFVTGWGDRIVINLKKGILEEPNNKLFEKMRSFENKLILDSLNKHYEAFKDFKTEENRDDDALSKRLENSGINWNFHQGFLIAAIRNKVSFDTEKLNQILKFEYGRWSTCAYAIIGYEQTSCPLRIAIKILIRMIGDVPIEYPCYIYKKSDYLNRRDKKNFVELKIPELVEGRDEKLKELSIEMTSNQIIEFVGSPDFIDYFDELSWIYFYGTGESFSVLRIAWKNRKEGKEIDNLEFISPYPLPETFELLNKLIDCP